MQAGTIMGASLSAAGRHFRQSLTARDVQTVLFARNSFQLSTVLPLLLYHLKLSEPNPKFPCTISHSIRQGVPKVAANAFWLVGWAAMLSVFVRRGGPLGRWFAIQMFATGVITTMVCPVGVSENSDTIHFVTAGLYMIDHHILFDFLNTRFPYRFGFYASFLIFAWSIMRHKKLHKTVGILPAESPHWTSHEEYCKQLEQAGLTAGQRRELAMLDYAIMAFEYGLFVSFVSGMGSGLAVRSQLQQRG